MAQIFPIIFFAIATIAIAYLLALLGWILPALVGLFGNIPDWTWTVVLAGGLVATLRLLRY